MVFCEVDDALALDMRASLLLHDDELEERALAPCAVDRLMDGECLVEQLDATQPRKKRRVDEHDNDDGDELACSISSASELDQLLAASSDRDTTTTDCDDDDGADALIAELGDGTWHVDDDENDAVAEALRVVNSQEKRLLRTDSCCSTFSLASSVSGIGGDDSSHALESNTNDRSHASKACACGRLTDDEPFMHSNGAKEYLDLHVRYGVHVRVADVAVVDSHTQFTLRVSDSETKRSWDVKKSSSEMVEFYRQVKRISTESAPVKRDLCGSFRSLRRFHLPKALFHFRGALLHQRKVVFDSFLRQTAALVAPAPLGPRRRRAVLLLQEFCGVHRHCEVFDRTLCSCAALQHHANAQQLVAEIFATPSHSVYQDCERFVAALTRSSYDTRRSKLTVRKARAILKAVARKMTELKRRMFDDANLRRQLLAARSERSDDDHEELVEEIRHAVCAFVEKHVMVPLEDHVYEALHTIHTDDDELRLRNKLRVMQSKDQSYFGIPAHMVSTNDWADARRELARISEYSLPLDKLKCIVRSASAIFRSCLHSAGSSSSLTSVEQFGPTITTDEFIAINLFVVVQSAGSHSQLLVTKELLRLMCDYHDATGEIGYYLTNFEAAIEIVERHQDPLRPMFQ